MKKAVVVLLIVLCLVAACGIGESPTQTPIPQAPASPSPVVATAQFETNSSSPPLVLLGTLIDGTGADPLPDAALVIRGDRIVAVGPRGEVSLPPGAQIVELPQATILPGFINTHVHNAYNAYNLQIWARSGVTTVRDLGERLGRTYFAIRDRLRADPLNARLIAAGPLVTVPGGYPIAGNDFPSLTVTSPEDARQKIEQLIDDGADVIKITLTSGRAPSLSPEEAAAIVETAHARGMPVTAHATTAQDLRRALDAGVDDIAHMAVDRVSDQVLRRMVDAGVSWVPTLEALENRGQNNLRRFIKAGGRVALGNDAGYLPGLEVGMPMREIQAMHDAGMTPMQIIVASTRDAAYVCHCLSTLGTLEVGKYADVLVVDGNPLQDLQALKNVRMVVHSGVIVGEPVPTTAPPTNTPIPPTDTAIPTPTETAIPPATQTPLPADTPTFEEADCAFKVPEGYQPKCGYLIVPEDRSNPQGRHIRLHVAIFASTGANPAPDPVIHLAGGPGSSALVAAIPILRKGGSEILKQRDYILFDQRGTQYSDPYLYCLTYDEYLWDARELDISLDEYYDGALPKLAACIQDWQAQGIDLAAYTSAESAADVNDLRLVLGYDQVNLYGTSYGTRLALTVLRDHPEGFRSVILDSVYPPQVDIDLELAVNAHRSLQQVFQACAADDACSGKYGDIEAKFYEVIDRLEKAPVVVEAFGPYRDQPYNVYVDGDLFLDAVFMSLYSRTSIADIPHFAHAAHEGSYAELSGPVGGAIGSPVSTGLFWSVTCGEEVPFEIDGQRLPDSARVPLVLREHFTERYTLDVCQVWNVPPVDAVENEAVISDIPTLLFSGGYDPITPPNWAEETAQTLSVHYYYEFPNVAHGVMRSDPCALQMGLAFLDDPLHAPESACMEQAQGIQFH